MEKTDPTFSVLNCDDGNVDLDVPAMKSAKYLRLVRIHATNDEALAKIRHDIAAAIRTFGMLADQSIQDLDLTSLRGQKKKALLLKHKSVLARLQNQLILELLD